MNHSFLKKLDIGSENIGCFNGNEWKASGESYAVSTPIDGSDICKVTSANLDDYELCVK